MDHPQGVLRTGDRATVQFEFISHPEFIKEGMKLLFREGKTKVCFVLTSDTGLTWFIGPWGSNTVVMRRLYLCTSSCLFGYVSQMYGPIPTTEVQNSQISRESSDRFRRTVCFIAALTLIVLAFRLSITSSLISNLAAPSNTKLPISDLSQTNTSMHHGKKSIG